MLPRDEGQAPTVRINTDLIPPWVAEYLAECLLESVRDFFSIPENQVKFEKWQAERERLKAQENPAGGNGSADTARKGET